MPKWLSIVLHGHQLSHVHGCANQGSQALETACVSFNGWKESENVVQGRRVKMWCKYTSQLRRKVKSGMFQWTAGPSKDYTAKEVRQARPGKISTLRSLCGFHFQIFRYECITWANYKSQVRRDLMGGLRGNSRIRWYETRNGNWKGAPSGKEGGGGRERGTKVNTEGGGEGLNDSKAAKFIDDTCRGRIISYSPFSVNEHNHLKGSCFYLYFKF